MSKKSPKIADRIAAFHDAGWPAHYLGYFDCFNIGQYYEAHDVLEELWLSEGRTGANYAFYKGLIQLAGAYVHLQKNRLKPSVALFQLAEANLRRYPEHHQGLDLEPILQLIHTWRARIEQGQFTQNPLGQQADPQLSLPRAP